MALPSPSCQPAYPHQQGPLIPSSVFSSDRELQELVNRRDMRISSTHDLAEFLRSSRPEDYSRPAKASDDLAIDSGHRKMSFKFLKSASRDLLSQRKNSVSLPIPSTIALPEKVRPEKTSKGNSYLAIQVDYTPGRDSESAIASPWTPSSSEYSGREGVRKATSADFSSDRSNYRNSSVSQAWKDHDSAFGAGYDRINSTDTRAMTRWMRNSSGSDLSSCQVGLVVSPLTAPQPQTSYSIKVPKQRASSTYSYTSIPPDYSKPCQTSKFSTIPKLYPDSSPVQRRYSSDSTLRGVTLSAQPARFSSPIRKDDIYLLTSPPISSNVGSYAQLNVKPETYSVISKSSTQPGPPPTRGLPSLPEGHDDAVNLAIKIRAAAATRSSIGSQLSLASDVGSLKNRRPATLSRARSEREISVKARKLKDLEDLKGKRSAAPRDVSHDPDCSTSKPKRSQGKPRRQKTGSTTFSISPITVVYEVSPDSRDGLGSQYSGETTLGDPSRPSSEVIKQQEEQKISQGTIANLEDRVRKLEQRNIRLEQALFAVLRGNILLGTGSALEGPSLSEILVGSDSVSLTDP
ncbi:hypothetical protein TWF106_000695 [Orbilia oligospora]|uniref:Uncharacterized protein n=1 Tax=Orbilia oligospora TaxID=2813651 RepID=A0A6G1LVP4_ORBOL|nr:hypothetical protein TWF679_009275 [Orbilia oligospora]KAF3206495.1 hypothetical protein TWF106_000695 [Orbilia oligospora]KAF3236028.1 hypothetical protein TWF192_000543 [Orbilia oligospora]